LDGDPAREVVWAQLLELLDRPIDHELGAQIVPRTVCIDSGGMHTQEVYTFCRLNAVRRTPYGVQQILAIQGQRYADKPIMGKPGLRDISKGGRMVKGGVKLWPVGSTAAKKVIYARINIELPGPGYVHTSSALTEDFYDQLTAERLITKYVKGFATQEWLLPAGRRNEALDCAVYALAAAHQLGLPRFGAGDWNKARSRLTKGEAIAAAVPATDAAPAKQLMDKPPPLEATAPPPPRVLPRQVPVRPPQRRPNFTNNW
jgi:phage terminase large subunit GpA-like protein